MLYFKGNQEAVFIYIKALPQACVKIQHKGREVYYGLMT